MRVMDRIRRAGMALIGKTVYGPNDVWMRGGMVDMTGGLNTDHVAGAYEKSAIAYACIERQAQDVAGVPVKVLRDPQDFNSELSDADPMVQMLKRPNAAMTTSRLLSWSVMLRQLRGEFFWVFDNPNRPKEVIPWHDPRHWHENTGEQGELVSWEYRSPNGRNMRLLAGEVLWVGSNNPANPYRGMSPLQAASKALDIDIYGHTLSADMLKRGGERGLVLSTDSVLQDKHYKQLMQNLQRRRPGRGQSSRDMIVDNGLRIENPDLTKEDIDILAWLNASKDDICHVFGMAPVLIGDDDSAQFKSAPEATKIYWNQTLLPIIRQMEDAFDRFFVDRRGLKGYIRFDTSQVPALQEDANEQMELAQRAWTMGASFSAVNERYGLGFPDDAAEAADMSGYFNSSGNDDEPEPEKGRRTALTNKIIRQRARSPLFKVARERRRGRLERSTWDAYKRIAADYKKRTVAIAKEVLDARGVNEGAAQEIVARIRSEQAGLGDALVEATRPMHVEALQLGQASVLELVDGKSLPWSERVKLLSGLVNSDEIMAQRGNYIRASIADDMVSSVNAAVRDLVSQAGEAGEPVGWVTDRMGDVWASWSRGHAATIARTEIGTMYNTGRVEEMGAQGFDTHEWMASIDEATRTSHQDTHGKSVRIGERFEPVGLVYPQQDGGPADEVINCRCETIPTVED